MSAMVVQTLLHERHGILEDVAEGVGDIVVQRREEPRYRLGRGDRDRGEIQAVVELQGDDLVPYDVEIELGKAPVFVGDDLADFYESAAVATPSEVRVNGEVS